MEDHIVRLPKEDIDNYEEALFEAAERMASEVKKAARDLFRLHTTDDIAYLHGFGAAQYLKVDLDTIVQKMVKALRNVFQEPS